MQLETANNISYPFWSRSFKHMEVLVDLDFPNSYPAQCLSMVSAQGCLLTSPGLTQKLVVKTISGKKAPSFTDLDLFWAG